MLTGLLKVRTATAKQAVIAAINLLGMDLVVTLFFYCTISVSF